MLIFTLVVGFISAFEIFSVLHSLSPKALKVLLGYIWLLEIFLSISLGLAAAGAAGITALAVSAVAGFMITVSLHFAKANVLGYAKIERKKGSLWKCCIVEYPPTGSPRSIGSFLAKAFLKTKDCAVSATSGFTSTIVK